MSTASKGQAASDNVASENVCTFWLGHRCFALDVKLVGEVLTVDHCLDVPLAPPAVQGLFNLRGVPVALVDLSALLDAPSPPPGAIQTALVIRTADLMVGLAVDRLGAVVFGREARLVRATDADEHPLVRGFLERPAETDDIVTVLEPTALIARLEELRFVQREH